MASEVYGAYLKEGEREELEEPEETSDLVRVWWLGWDDFLAESMEVRGGLVLSTFSFLFL